MTTKSDGNSLQLQAEQLALILQGLPLGVATSLLLAATALSVLWPVVDHAAATAWFALLLAVSAARLLLRRHHTRTMRGEQPLRQLRLAPLVRASSALAGLTWGSAALALYTPGDLVHQLFLVFVLAGVIAGSATMLAADRRVALLFQLPVLAPIALRLALEADRMHYAMSGLIALYATFVCISVYRVGAHTAQNISLRLQAVQRERALHESEARNRQLAHHDALTGLPNRHALQSELPAMLEHAAHGGHKVALLCLDLDDFKDINDTRGHASGDHVMIEVATRLRGCVTASDLVVRTGGDEFIVVMRQASQRADIDALLARIRAALAAPLPLAGETLNVRASIGIGIYPDDGGDASLLLRHADTALYRAKAQGRNGLQYYDAAMSAEVGARLAMEQALLRALDNGELFVAYQPLVSLPSGRVHGLEALARWHEPERGLISPAEFIGVAERCGLIERLGELVLRNVVRQLQAWQAEMLPVVPVAINVSPNQLAGGKFAGLVARLTEEHGVDPALLQFEITENLLMGHSEAHLASLEALRRLGARVSIDDFGTGYSSLSYLKHLPIDCVKIDRSFVRDMQEDERDAAIVSAIVSIAHSLGLSVVAEGVETAQQASYLSKLGCDVAQGFHYFHPLSAGQCRDLLTEQARRSPPIGETMRLRVQRWLLPRTGSDEA